MKRLRQALQFMLVPSLCLGGTLDYRSDLCISDIHAVIVGGTDNITDRHFVYAELRLIGVYSRNLRLGPVLACPDP